MAQPTTAFQDTLGDRYQLDTELGSGGQGSVFSARDRRLGRTVAIKFLRPDIATLLGPYRFQREIAIAASLSHPNIVPLLDSGGAGDQLYYTMPLVEGESLRARLRRQSQLPVDDALRIVRDVAAGLDYAHEHGYAHRDIKPENILLTRDRAIVLDFGIARAIELSGTDSVTSGNIVIGTPHYMSPEQGSGQRQVDGQTDIYALGCVLYEMLAGSPPFTGATAQAIIARHLVDPPPALSVVRSTVSPALEEVIRKSLAKVPADRYASGAEMVRALDQARRHPGGRALWRRRLTQAGLVIVPAAAALTAWLAWPRATLDPNKVMGFPLLGSAGVPRFAVEQVEEAIAAAMQDTEPLRWLRARLFLGAAAGSALPADSATHLARARGARYWLGGSLAKVGDSLVVRLELFDAKGDSLLASRSETAPLTDPAYVPAFRAVNMLLPRVVGRSTHVAQKYLERHPPAAVANWLAGEVAYRNARYRDALASYRSALAADSTLAPAALKGAMTAGWLAEFPVADSLTHLALRREAELPAPNRLLAHSLVNFIAGNGDSAMYWAREAVQAAPEWSEAWYQVGEAAYHLWPTGDNPDSVAHSAFRRSLALDPDFAPVVFHLAELAMVSGALGEADSLVKRHHALSADTAQQLQLELMLRCVRGDRQVDWAPLAAADDPGGIQLLAAGKLLAAGGRHLQCAEGAYQAALRSPAPDEDLRRRWNAALSLHHVYLARGERDRARAIADSVVASGVAAGRGLRIVDALLGMGSDAAGAAEIAWLEQSRDSTSIRRAWWFGEWSSAHDDVERLDAVTHRIRVLAAGSGAPPDQVPARVMSARLLLARGDTAGAIDSLGAIRPLAPLGDLIYGYWEPLAAERLLLAKLLLARGRAAEALRVAESFDGERAVLDLAFLRPSLELRRQAAARLGDRKSEREIERRLAALSKR
ncbi:MAG: protein kinase domain-containing protein [Gemmatimonadales bacterium]